jgi:hypothetical protein
MASRTRSLVILLLAGMMAQISCVQVYRVLFAMNRKAISERLCEKRTRDCCGKCFLQKKIASAQDAVGETPAEKSTSTKTPIDPPELMPGLEPNVNRLEVLIESRTIPASVQSVALPEGHDLPIDHPPDILPHMTAA